jgi:hypothetical protein
VGVDVNESRHDEASRRIEFLMGGNPVADLDDPAIENADVSDVGGPARPVDHRSAPDAEVKHRRPAS